MRWPNRLTEIRCIRLYIHTSTKSFSDFDLIWCVGRPRPDMRTSVTSIRSKVKVPGLQKFQKLHFLAWSSILMVDDDSMGPGLQHVGAWFLNFLIRKLPREFKLCRMSILHEFQRAIFPYCVWIATHCACWYELDLIQGQGQGHGASEVLKIAENCTLLGQSLPPFWHGAQNQWLIMIVWDLAYSLSEPDFRISFKKAIAWVQTLWNVDITWISNGHISILLEATVMWSARC